MFSMGIALGVGGSWFGGILKRRGSALRGTRELYSSHGRTILDQELKEVQVAGYFNYCKLKWLSMCVNHIVGFEGGLGLYTSKAIRLTVSKDSLQPMPVVEHSHTIASSNFHPEGHWL